MSFLLQYFYSPEILPVNIQFTFKVITSFKDNSIIDFSLINHFSSQLISQEEDQLKNMNILIREISEVFQSNYEEYKQDPSKLNYLRLVDFSIIIYYLLYNMQDSKIFYEEFFKPKSVLWGVLIKIFQELSDNADNTDFIAIFRHILEDEIIISIMYKLNMIGYLDLHNKKIKYLQVPSDNYYKVDNINFYKSIISKIKSLNFDYEALFGSKTLSPQDKSVLKSNFVQSIIRISLSDIIRTIEPEEKVPFISNFFQETIKKTCDFYLNKIGSNYKCLFRREQVYDDIIKYLFFMYGNEFYLNSFRPLVLSFLSKTPDPTEFSERFERLIKTLKANFPKILVILLKYIKDIIKDRYNLEEDNFHPCFTILFFNFFCSPKIEEIFMLGISNKQAIYSFNKLINNICTNKKFSETDVKLVQFNDFISIFNYKLKKALKEMLDSIDESTIEESIIKSLNIKRTNKFLFAFDCTFISRILATANEK